MRESKNKTKQHIQKYYNKFEETGLGWEIEDPISTRKLKPETDGTDDGNGKIRETVRALIAIIVLILFGWALLNGDAVTTGMRSILSMIIGAVIGYYFGAAKGK